ncbi:MAG: TRAP transporter substrate-binding protein [Bacillota bacterium]|nr:TRAP transporter substrate-binding protein [Bacillota bacterium]
MKKQFVLLLMALLVCGMMVACATEPVPESAPDATAEVPTYEALTLKMGHSAPVGSTLDVVAQSIVDEVAAKTDGLLTIEIYPAAQLGDENVMFDSVMSGTLDMDFVGTPILSTVMPEFNAVSLPFLFKDVEEFFSVVTSEEFISTTNAIVNEKNLELIGYPNGEMRGLSNVKHEVRTPEDLKGLTIRVMSGSMYTDMFQAMGAITSTLAFGEVYSALQQGVIDGEDNGLNMLDMMKFMEVEKYHTALGHTVQTNPLVVNKQVWDSLPAEWQQIIRDAVKTQEDNYITGILEPQIAASKAVCEENGVNIVMELTDEEYQAFRDSVQSVYEKYQAVIGDEFYTFILDLVESYR